MLGLDSRTLQQAWTWFLFALGIAIVYAIRNTLALFALALFLALMLAPLVTLVERYTPVQFPPAVALAVVYVLFLGALFSILAAITSTITNEAGLLAQRLPAALGENPLHRLPLPVWLEPLRDRAAALLDERLSEMGRNAIPLLGGAFQRLASGLGTLLSGVLIPIVAFFFLKDGKAIRRALLRAMDEEHRPLIGSLLSDLREVLSQYVRALVILSAVTFVCYFSFLALTGAPYVALLSGAAALLELIPGVGPFSAAVTIIIVTSLSGYPHWLLLLAFFVVYRLVLDYGLQPVLMSAGVELHPMLVIFGAFAGAEIAGVMGLFFSIPLLAAGRVILKRLRAQAAQSVTHP